MLAKKPNPTAIPAHVYCVGGLAGALLVLLAFVLVGGSMPDDPAPAPPPPDPRVAPERPDERGYVEWFHDNRELLDNHPKSRPTVHTTARFSAVLHERRLERVPRTEAEWEQHDTFEALRSDPDAFNEKLAEMYGE